MVTGVPEVIAGATSAEPQALTPVAAPSPSWDASRLTAPTSDPRLGMGRPLPEGLQPFLDGITHRHVGPSKATRIAAAVLGGIAMTLAPGIPAKAAEHTYTAETRPCMAVPTGYQPVARPLMVNEAPASALLIDRVRDFASGGLDGDGGGGGLDLDTGAGSSMSMRIDPELVASLREHARQRGVSLSQAVQDLVAVYLTRSESAQSSANAGGDAPSTRAGQARVQVQLDEQTMSRARQQALARGVPVGAVVRDAIAGGC